MIEGFQGTGTADTEVVVFVNEGVAVFVVIRWAIPFRMVLVIPLLSSLVD